jgi:hypothetical protein
VPVQKVALYDSFGVRVVNRLPVAATPIMMNLVVGTWSVALYHDGVGPLAIAEFEVQP